MGTQKGVAFREVSWFLPKTKRTTDYKLKLKELLDQISQKGYRVKFVPDAWTKDYVGMNYYAAKSMGFKLPNGHKIGKHDLLVDKWLDYKDKFGAAKHEFNEAENMSHGYSYWKAHSRALKNENGLINHHSEK